MGWVKRVVVVMVMMAAAAGGQAVPRSWGASAQGKIVPAPVENVRVEDGDGRATISWAHSRTTGGFKGIRLYRALGGVEIRFGQPVEVLLEDVGVRTSWKVSSLKNGEIFEYVLKAYDSEGREFWQTSVFAHPGTDPRGKPRTPAMVHAAAGDGRVGLFWARNLEADLAFYEVFRKGPEDADFRLVGRIAKYFNVSEGQKGSMDEPRSFQALTPTAYLDRSVANGSVYQYRVRAVDKGGNAGDLAAPVSAQPRPYRPATGECILLIVNATTGDSNDNGIGDSEEVARYYAEKRGVPASHIVRLPLNKNPYAIDYARDIQRPLQEFLLSNNLIGTVTTLVPCYGIPTGIGGRAMDSRLADLFDRFTWGRTMGTQNTYFGSDRHFDGTYGTYLVTRLDGPTVEIAKGLVDKALYAENHVAATSGAAYLGGRGSELQGDLSIRKTAELARKLGVQVTIRNPGTYAEHELGPDALWYFAWYHHYIDPIKGEWPPGAVGAHLTSYSFMGIREKDPKRKSWVQGLLEKGITATFGSVVEPYLGGFTRAEIFFGHFWSGEDTFAESFFMATPTVQWAMSAVGDPLFRLKRPAPARPGNGPSSDSVEGGNSRR